MRWHERQPRRLRGVLAKIRHGAGEVENVDDESGYTVYALEFQLPVADHPGGPHHEADPADIDERELAAVDDKVAAGPRGLVEDRREPVVGAQVELAAQVHGGRVTLIRVRLKPG